MVGVQLVAGSDFDFEIVVEHELLSESESGKISEKLKTPLNKFPKILKSDPQIMDLSPLPGQLVAIHRKDLNVKYTYYRVVVDTA